MKKFYAAIILFTLLAMAACSVNSPTSEAEQGATATATLPDPQVYVTRAPDVDGAVSAFMDAWRVEDYAAMYAILSGESQSQVSIEEFSGKYNDTAVTMTLAFEDGVQYEILSSVTNPNSASATVQVNYHTNLFGTFTRDLTLPFTREAGEWRLVWEVGLILPELQGGNVLEIVRQTTPRGNIYASDGSPIAAQEDAVAIGFIPGYLDDDLLGLFYRTMADLTIYQVDEVREMTEGAFESDYVALGEAPQSEVDRNMSALSMLSGVYLNYYSTRFYYDGGIAPQAVGHLTYISEEELDRYSRLGYAPSERFGRTGLEYSFENELSGERGASLYVKDANGQIVSKLVEKGTSPAQSLTTTIDPRLQYWLQQSLGDYRGAIVVMEIDTGRVIAMVSNPQFNPNLFDFNNQNYVYANNPYNEPNDPVFNRATSGQYPLGSVFKIITMAAALETGVYTHESEIYCDHSVIVCGGTELFDWTYEKEKPPSGQLTLPEGLMRSCNPWFYTIGEGLFNAGYPNAIADLSRDFGLGEETGIEISEQPGNIPENITLCDQNTQLAIGQGDMTVTPLQVANFVAAVGNGGTLYRPALVEQIGAENGTPSYTFEPEVIGRLPVSEENLAIIRDAMESVIKNGRGTAHSELGTMPYPVFGKTGTAQNPFGESHAWFAGFTGVGNEDRPDIAVAVILENAGEGSEMAAPVFRRVVSLYFSNYSNPGYTLPWEAYPYVVASPTPIPTNTSIPTNTPVPTNTPIFTETPATDEEATQEP
ncbi:MAG: penicillin-binding transpeptidase domain-containing protein [Chloroflexota bacterium]|nr:penicillin-binding transpeptidase domain-containing protein [Chloroflexota bacterium]